MSETLGCSCSNSRWDWLQEWHQSRTCAATLTEVSKDSTTEGKQLGDSLDSFTEAPSRVVWYIEGAWLNPACSEHSLMETGAWQPLSPERNFGHSTIFRALLCVSQHRVSWHCAGWNWMYLFWVCAPVDLQIRLQIHDHRAWEAGNSGLLFEAEIKNLMLRKRKKKKRSLRWCRVTFKHGWSSVSWQRWCVFENRF